MNNNNNIVSTWEVHERYYTVCVLVLLLLCILCARVEETTLHSRWTQKSPLHDAGWDPGNLLHYPSPFSLSQDLFHFYGQSQSKSCMISLPTHAHVNFMLLSSYPISHQFPLAIKLFCLSTTCLYCLSMHACMLL